jgi:hypothetical protein
MKEISDGLVNVMSDTSLAESVEVRPLKSFRNNDVTRGVQHGHFGGHSSRDSATPVERPKYARSHLYFKSTDMVHKPR